MTDPDFYDTSPDEWFPTWATVGQAAAVSVAGFAAMTWWFWKRYLRGAP